MLRASFILLMLLGIAACTAKPIEPKASEKPPQPVLQKATQKGEMKEYLCKDDKIVRIVFHTTKHKKNKTRSISLTFNNVTHKLSPTIAENTAKNHRTFSSISRITRLIEFSSHTKTLLKTPLCQRCPKSKTPLCAIRKINPSLNVA